MPEALSPVEGFERRPGRDPATPELHEQPSLSAPRRGRPTPSGVAVSIKAPRWSIQLRREEGRLLMLQEVNTVDHKLCVAQIGEFHEGISNHQIMKERIQQMNRALPSVCLQECSMPKMAKARPNNPARPLPQLQKKKNMLKLAELPAEKVLNSILPNRNPGQEGAHRKSE